MTSDLLYRIVSITRVDMVYDNGTGALTAFFDSVEDSPLMTDPDLLMRLRAGAEANAAPFLYRDDYQAFFGVIAHENGWLYLGPMCNSRLDPLRRGQFYRSHGVTSKEPRALRYFSLQQIKDVMILTATLLLGREVPEEELALYNPVSVSSEQELQKERHASLRSEETARDEEAYRHTYHEEQQVMLAVREGRYEDAVKLSARMDSGTGLFSDFDLVHWRTLAIVGITLTTRAAIAAGVTPILAYEISGYYINKCNAATDKGALLHYRNRAFYDLCERVNQTKARPAGSAYTTKSKDYIQKHYREKIYIEDIAGPLGISAGYLSKVFKEETGMLIQDYINTVRVESAANLLIYSEESLPEIAAYVHFPTQSYFGKIFKKIKGMTPNEFRKQNRVGEFWNE